MGSWIAGVGAGLRETGSVVGGVLAFGLVWAGASTVARAGDRLPSGGHGALARGRLQRAPRRRAARQRPARLVAEEARARLLVARGRASRTPRPSCGWCSTGPRPARPSAELASQRPRVVFAPSADDWLLAAVRDGGRPGAVVVVTADRQLADTARHRGARVVSPRAFLARCGGSSGTDSEFRIRRRPRGFAQCGMRCAAAGPRAGSRPRARPCARGCATLALPMCGVSTRFGSREQRARGGQRLALEDVEAGGREAARSRAPRRARPRRRCRRARCSRARRRGRMRASARGAEQAARLGRERDVDAHEVGRARAALERDALDARAPRRGVRDQPSTRMPKPARARATALPDRAEPDDAERRAVRGRARAAGPAPSSLAPSGPSRTKRSASATRRAAASSSAKARSAVVSVRTPGVWPTGMPRARRGGEVDVVEPHRAARDDAQPRARRRAAPRRSRSVSRQSRPVGPRARAASARAAAPRAPARPRARRPRRERARARPPGRRARREDPRPPCAAFRSPLRLRRGCGRLDGAEVRVHPDGRTVVLLRPRGRSARPRKTRWRRAVHRRSRAPPARPGRAGPPRTRSDRARIVHGRDDPASRTRRPRRCASRAGS